MFHVIYNVNVFVPYDHDTGFNTSFECFDTRLKLIVILKLLWSEFVETMSDVLNGFYRS